MKYRLVILFSLTTLFSSGQQIPPFHDKDFPLDKFIVKKEQRTLGTITVNLVQTKPKKTNRSAQFSCRTWLTIKNKTKVVKERNEDCDGVGGCSGLFFPESQPSKDLIIVSKFGDYDGRLLIINDKGELNDYSGGKFYVSADNKYVFTNHDSDLSGVSIIDLTKNKLVYTGELEQYIGDWYFKNGEYFAVIMEEGKVNGDTGLLIFDFGTKTFKEKKSKDKLDPKNKLKVYNDYQMAPECSCGK